MSDITISFPPGFAAWVLLGQALPATTLVLVALLAVFFFRGRGRGRVWLIWALVLVGGVWLAGLSFWAAGLEDRIRTRIYEARHHYRLDKTTRLAGIEVPGGSWVTVDDHGVPYALEVGANAVTIDGARWRGDVYLVPPWERKPANLSILKSAMLAEDAVVQGIPCRAGGPVEFFNGALTRCTAAQRVVVSGEIPDGGGSRLVDLACAADQEIRLNPFVRRRLDGCVLAAAAAVGSVVCAGGAEIVLAGDGLTICTLAAAQKIGPFQLPAGARVHFDSGRLDEVAAIATPLAISGTELPPGSTVALCLTAWEAEWAAVPQDRYATIAGIKLTGRINFDCGRFQYGSLFEATALDGRRLPRGAPVSAADLSRARPR